MSGWGDDYYDEDDEQEIDVMTENATETPQGLNITVTIDPHQIRGIEHAVIQAIARQFEKRLEQAVNNLVAAKTEEAVHDLALSKVDEYLARPRQKTNSYGEPVGDPITPLEILMKQFAEYMQQTVDSDGRVSSYRNTMKREDHLIAKLGIAPLQTAVQEEIQKISAKAKGEIQKTVSAYIAQLLAPDITVPKLTPPAF